MSYSIEIKTLGESGTPVGHLQSFGSDTVTEAINLARTKLTSVPRAAHPLCVEIFDRDQRLILSYTSNVRLAII